MPNAKVAGDNTAGSTPVPVREAVWGEFEALSLTVRVPARLPDTEGVKVTEMVQFAPAAKVPGDIGQVEVGAKSPVAAMLVMVRGVL